MLPQGFRGFSREHLTVLLLCLLWDRTWWGMGNVPVQQLGPTPFN